MSLGSEKFHHAFEVALKTLAESGGGELAEQIQPILIANLHKGRLQTFTEENLDRVPAYVALVADKFTSLHDLLHELQLNKNTEVWEPLFTRMQTWAYNFFLRKGFAADEHTVEISGECATEAAMGLLTAHFPYDTDFEPWAHIIVQNACRKFIDKAFRKSVVPSENIVELEDDLPNGNELHLEIQTLQKERGAEIVDALAQLTETRRSVVQYIYFDQLEPEEAAQKMGKSVGAIYSLRFNALEDLRKILSTIRNNINE